MIKVESDLRHSDSFGYWLGPWKEVEIKDGPNPYDHLNLIMNRRGEEKIQALARLIKEA